MPPVQPCTVWCNCHEELGAICVAIAVVCHGNDATLRKGQSLMELIHEWFPIDALASLTCPSRVTSLHHEVLDDPVQHRLVIVPLHA